VVEEVFERTSFATTRNGAARVEPSSHGRSRRTARGALRRSSSPSASRSQATNEAGACAESSFTRDAACVVDGEIVIVGVGVLDFETLLLRIHPVGGTVNQRHLKRNRKFVDSPQEGDGFELSVPRQIRPVFETAVRTP
jgi:hypothetical protein